jgi:hypothetical protein
LSKKGRFSSSVSVSTVRDLHAREEFGAADALADEIGGAHSGGPFAFGRLLLAGNDHDRKFADALDLRTAHAVEEFEAVDLGHRQVADDDPDRRVEQDRLPRGFPVRDLADVEPVLQVPDERGADDAGVVGDEDAWLTGAASRCSDLRFVRHDA